MKRAQVIHYLRIAVTALCLTASVLLIALWVRSYWWADSIDIPMSSETMFYFESRKGELYLSLYDDTGVDTSGLPPQRRTSKWLVDEVDELPNEFSTFEWYWDTSYKSVGLPTWLPLIGFITAAVVPWISRLPRRFSLRTLLIATTLVAIAFGLIAYAARRRTNINDDGPVISLPSPAEWEAITGGKNNSPTH
jgi:hypothetical protein